MLYCLNNPDEVIRTLLPRDEFCLQQIFQYNCCTSNAEFIDQELGHVLSESKACRNSKTVVHIPSKHMTSKGRWVLVDFWSRRHITNIQRHSDVKMKRLINVGF